MSQRFYQEDEAEAILRLAAQRSSGAAVSHERLLATAAELGISPEAVDEAARLLGSQQQEVELRQRYEQRMKGEFYTHVILFVSVNVFLVLINYVTSREYFWAGWAIMGWGLVLAIHFGITFYKGSSLYGADYEKWKARQLGGEAEDPANPRLLIGVMVSGKKTKGRGEGHRFIGS